MVYTGMCYKCIVISELLKERDCWVCCRKYIHGWKYMLMLKHLLNTIPGAEDVTQGEKRYNELLDVGVGMV